jgi:hypothetical protein
VARRPLPPLPEAMPAWIKVNSLLLILSSERGILKEVAGATRTALGSTNSDNTDQLGNKVTTSIKNQAKKHHQYSRFVSLTWKADVLLPILDDDNIANIFAQKRQKLHSQMLL